MAPNDPYSGDPQSIPIDNYTGTSPRKTWHQKTSRSQARLLHNPALRGKIARQNYKQSHLPRITRTRKIRIPNKFKDFVTIIMEAVNGGYKHICEDCGQEYANRRNLKPTGIKDMMKK